MVYESTRSAGDAALPEVSTAKAYVGHFFAYAALAFCAQMTLLRRDLLALSLVVGGATLLGGSLEVYQSTLPGREASLFDAIANLLGAVAGVAFALYVAERWMRGRADSGLG